MNAACTITTRSADRAYSMGGSTPGALTAGTRCAPHRRIVSRRSGRAQGSGRLEVSCVLQGLSAMFGRRCPRYHPCSAAPSGACGSHRAISCKSHPHDALTFRRRHLTALCTLRWFPYGVLRVRVAVAGGLGQQAPVDLELEQYVGVGRKRGSELRALVDELLPKVVTQHLICDDLRPPSHVEGVLVVRARKRMHRKAAVTPKIVLLGRGDDEGEHRIIGEQRTYRMEARSGVLADRRKEGKPHPVLIQQRP